MMASPTSRLPPSDNPSSSSFIDNHSGAGAPSNTDNPQNSQEPYRSHTLNVVGHRIDSGFKSIKSFTRRIRKADHLSLQDWNPPDRPYRDYVRQLIASGWISLQELEDFMGTPAQVDPGLAITVLDINHEFKISRQHQVHTERDLKEFMETHDRVDSKVRLYVAEYDSWPSPMLIETFGAELKLDPRFFHWCIHSSGHDFRPSQRHRAPYASLGFGVLDASRPGKTLADQFKVMIYIQPDESGDGWTGIILSDSHKLLDISPRILTDPPPFRSQLPPPSKYGQLSFREFYVKSLEFVSLVDATTSPFYAVSNIFRLNCFCWNQIITAIRQEDRNIRGISDTTIGHTEEINKSFTVLKRGGSYGWAGQSEPAAVETRSALLEDFQHLVDQTELLWQNRDKMASIKQRNSDARWTTLTNAFTYIFAPITVISGIYGMNVSQISGTSSNPSIWQPFVAIAAMNIVVVLGLALWNWIHVMMKHGRRAGMREIFGFAVGKVAMQ